MKQEIITILIAMAPTLEAHAAIVTAVGLFKFSVLKAFVLSVIGTTVIVAPLLLFWEKISEFFMHRIYFVNRFLTWLFSYTRRKHSKHFEQYDTQDRKIDIWKAIALYVFVAVPGPFTGVWGGTVAAYVFGIPFRYAFLALVLGALSVAALDALIIGGFFSLIL